MADQTDPFCKDTPAGRVYQILLRAEEKKASTVKATWAQVFSVDPNNDAEIRYRLTQLISLIGEAQQAFHSTPHGKGFGDVISPLIACLANPEIGRSWEDTGKSFQAAKSYLGMAASVSKVGKDLTPATADDLKGWRIELDGILEEVVAAEDIDADLRGFVVDHLTLIKKGLLEYQLRGSEGLAMAVRASMFAFITRSNEMEAEIAREEVDAEADEAPDIDVPRTRPFTRTRTFMSTMLSVFRYAKNLGKWLPEAAEAYKQLTDGSPPPTA